MRCLVKTCKLIDLVQQKSRVCHQAAIRFAVTSAKTPLNKQRKEIQYSSEDLYADPVSSKFLTSQNTVSDETDGDVVDAAVSLTNKERGAKQVQKFVARKFIGNQSYSKPRKIVKPPQEETELFTTENGIEWCHLPANDSNFSNTMISLRNVYQRQSINKLLLEGRRLIVEALLAGIPVHSIFFTHEEDLEKLPLVQGEVKCFKISPLRMNAWSSLETAPGLMAITDKPTVEYVKQRQSPDLIPVTIILDTMRDPGNMGSVIRALSASGCANVITMKGCCDVWESKVLRGGMGAHFSIPIHEKIQWEQIKTYLPDYYDVYLADSASYDVVSEVESFKIDSNTDTAAVDELELPIDQLGDDNISEKNQASPKKSGNKSISKPKLTKLPVLQHYKTDFCKSKHVVLIIGGEAEGASPAAYRFVHAGDGHRCHIPMVNNVDSLNVAAAVSVIVFEIRRQFAKSSSLASCQQHVQDVHEAV